MCRWVPLFQVVGVIVYVFWGVMYSLQWIKHHRGKVIFNHQVNIWSTVFLIAGVGDTKPKPVHEVYSNGLALPQVSSKYNDSHYSSDFDTTLYISNVSFSDAGTYSCSIRTDSKSFELYVIGKKQSSQTFALSCKTFSIFKATLNTLS